VKKSIINNSIKMQNTIEEHKQTSSLNAAIITISNTRTLENDDSGKLIKELLIKNNHKVIEHLVIKDDKVRIKSSILELVNKEIHGVITNGGTGITKTDVTIEAVKPLFNKELPGFSTVFQELSYNEIGSASILSRATAGIINNKAVFCLPGSPKAVELAMNKLILPEIGHIVKHLT